MLSAYLRQSYFILGGACSSGGQSVKPRDIAVSHLSMFEFPSKLILINARKSLLLIFFLAFSRGPRLLRIRCVAAIFLLFREGL